jgi:hypothetical protein
MTATLLWIAERTENLPMVRLIWSQFPHGANLLNGTYTTGKFTLIRILTIAGSTALSLVTAVIPLLLHSRSYLFRAAGPSVYVAKCYVAARPQYLGPIWCGCPYSTCIYLPSVPGTGMQMRLKFGYLGWAPKGPDVMLVTNMYLN